MLELFSGTGSVGRVAKNNGYDVISLDLKNADINCDIVEWDYKIYPVGYFDFVLCGCRWQDKTQATPRTS